MATVSPVLTPTQLAVVQRVADAVLPLQPQTNQQQQRAPQTPATPPTGTGRGRLVDILV
jgi:hypothetical protein